MQRDEDVNTISFDSTVLLLSYTNQHTAPNVHQESETMIGDLGRYELCTVHFLETHNVYVSEHGPPFAICDFIASRQRSLYLWQHAMENLANYRRGSNVLGQAGPYKPNSNPSHLST